MPTKINIKKLAYPGGFPLWIFLLNPGGGGCKPLYPTKTRIRNKILIINQIIFDKSYK